MSPALFDQLNLHVSTAWGGDLIKVGAPESLCTTGTTGLPPGETCSDRVAGHRDDARRALQWRAMGRRTHRTGSRLRRPPLDDTADSSHAFQESHRDKPAQRCGKSLRRARRCGWPPARPSDAGRRSPSSTSILRKNTRTSTRANAVIDQSAIRRRGRPGRAPSCRRSRPRHASQRAYGVEISGCRIARVPVQREPVLSSAGWQAQKPRCADGGSAMTRIIGIRAAGAALLLTSLIATGVLLAPASSGASSSTARSSARCRRPAGRDTPRAPPTRG